MSENFPCSSRFQFVRPLGEGGLGVVFEAFDAHRGAQVALKTLHRPDPGTIYRLKQEFRAIADLHHPNLVRLYELFGEGEHWWFTMELVNGVNFLDYVWYGAKTSPGCSGGGPRPLDPRQLRRLRHALCQLEAGLTALHQAGTLHRDIKPANIVVGKDDRLVLLDLSLAADMDTLRLSDATRSDVMGTIAYMSPEQLTGGDLSELSDWYSVGVMLFEVLTGHKPFGDLPHEIIPALTSRDGPSPDELAPEVPPELELLCRDLMRLEPGRRPNLNEIRRRLSKKPAASGEATTSKPAPQVEPGTRSAATALVGRQREIHALRRALDRIHSDGPKFVMVHGHSGCGKSALIEQFICEAACDAGTVILAGRCYEAESVPYKAVDSLVDSLCRYLRNLSEYDVQSLLPRYAAALARLFPVLNRVGAIAAAPAASAQVPDIGELRRRGVIALRELLGGVGDRLRLVLCVDDLHWGDLDSARLLTDVLTGVDSPRVLFIGCYRSEYLRWSDSLQLLQGERGLCVSGADVETLELGPLSLDEASGLAAKLLGSDSPRVQASAIARESHGNPYFVQELARDVREGVASSRPKHNGGSIALDEVIRRRAERLPGQALGLLRTVCVAGQPLLQADAFIAAGLGHDPLSSLASLKAQRLIRGRDEELIEPYHDRVREAICSRLDEETTRSQHANLAHALERSGHYDPETIATHFHGAEDCARAGHYFTRAADNASHTFAFDRAARLYRTAIDLSDRMSGDLHTLRVKLGDALANAGRGAEAAREFLRAQQGATPHQTLELQRRAAFEYCVSGYVDEGQKALDNLLERLGMRRPKLPSNAMALLLLHRIRLRVRGLSFTERKAADVSREALDRIDGTWTASAGLSMFDIVTGAGFQARNLIFALEAGEAFRIARGLAWEAAHCSNEGGRSWPRTQRLLTKASRLAERIDHPQAKAMVAMANGIAHYTLGRFTDAVPILESAINLFRSECTGVTWESDTANLFLLWSLTYQGEYSSMAARTWELLDDAQTRGDLYAVTNLGTFMVPHIRLMEDEADRAERELHEYETAWPCEGFHLQNLTALMSRTLIDIYRGDGQRAFERLQNQWATVEASQMLRIQLVDIFMHHFRARAALSAALHTADPRPFLRQARRDARRIRRHATDWGNGLASLAEAGIVAYEGDRVAASRKFDSAAQLLLAAHLTSHAAAALRRLGELLGGEEGRARINESNELLQARGVHNWDRMVAMHAPPYRLERGAEGRW